MPKRIQRRRTKNWRMPEGAIYVGHPSVFGNPFDWRILGRQGAARLYRKWLEPEGDAKFPKFSTQREKLLARLPELRGHDLCCWCSELDKNDDSVYCHANILLELANEDLETATRKENVCPLQERKANK